MGHVKQYTHPIGEVRGKDKNTYECVLKQDNFSSERGGEIPLRVGCHSGWTRLSFSMLPIIWIFQKFEDFLSLTIIDLTKKMEEKIDLKEMIE